MWFTISTNLRKKNHVILSIITDKVLDKDLKAVLKKKSCSLEVKENLLHPEIYS